jgi:hypothetical protein
MMFIMLEALPDRDVPNRMRCVCIYPVQYGGRVRHCRWFVGKVLLREGQVVEVDVFEMGYVWARIGKGHRVEG